MKPATVPAATLGCFSGWQQPLCSRPVLLTYANQAALMAANASSSRANVVYIQHSAAIGM